jgi:oxygen-dependent protoporphyrinogen oxidase
VALVRAGIRLRLAIRAYEKRAREVPGESPAERRARVLAYGDDRTFADWLGAVPGDADALFRVTITRSTAEPEEISFGHGAGYFALVWSAGKGLSYNVIGGASRFAEAIGDALPGRIETGAEVRRISRRGELLEISYGKDGGDHSVLARHVVVATKAFTAAAIVDDLPPDTRAALDAIPYGPTVVMGLLTGETGPMPWDGLYALATPKRSFSMLFNMANVLRPQEGERRAGGSLMVYRSGHAAGELLERSDEEIERAFVADLDEIYPEARGIVRETLLLRLPRMLPYVAPGRAALQPALERSLGNVHLVGDYIGGVYTETAIATGRRAAAEIVASLERDSIASAA